MRILVIEDNPGDARLIQETLKGSAGKFILDFAERLVSGLEFLLSQEDVDVVLLDLNLPDSRGLETFTKLQAHFSHLPVVILTAIGSEELGIQAVRQGAQDYLVKGQVDGELLRRTLTYAVERKRAEEALRDSEERFRLLVEGVRDYAIFLLDAEGRVISWNSSAEHIKGWTAHEIMGQHVSVFYPPELMAAGEPQNHLEIAAKNGVHHEEGERLRKDGSRFWADILTIALRRPDGRLRGFAKLTRDITERKKAEEERERLLVEVQKRAVELDLMVKELEAYNFTVSHDLKTPLRAMEGFSRALLEDYADKLDERGQRWLQAVRRGSLRLGEYLDALLDLSRLSRAPMRPDCVDLSHIAVAAAQDLRSTEPERPVEFVIAPDVAAKGDTPLLRLVMQNLLHNAWKFTSKHASARIEFGMTEREGEKVYYVRDDGVGFDMQYADKLFIAFQRMHHEHEFPGLGIGLASVQRIISRHGGRVWVEAAPEEGATFYFTLDTAGPATCSAA